MSRRPALLGLILLVILAMAGCSGLPTTSDVRAGRAIDNHAAPTVGNIEYPGPAAGASQKDIVGGFLDATAGTNQNYERAREYLTRSADRSWSQRTVVVTTGSRDLMASGSDSITATADSDAVLDAFPETLMAGVAQDLKALRLTASFAQLSRARPTDCSPLVMDAVASQIAAGDRRIVGVMIESNLVAGRQDQVPGQTLVYGQSITDGCIGWDATVEVLERLAAAVQRRRGTKAQRTDAATA